MIKVEMTLSFDDMESYDLVELAEEIRYAMRGQYMDVTSINVTRDKEENE